MEPCCAADVASEKSSPWRGKDQVGAARAEKHRAIRGLLKDESIWQVDGDCYDCLPPDRREKFEIVATDNVSTPIGKVGCWTAARVRGRNSCPG
jgi:hypothetical protein